MSEDLNKDTIVTVRGFPEPKTNAIDYMEDCPLSESYKKAVERYHAAIDGGDYDYLYQVTVCYGFDVLMSITGTSHEDMDIKLDHPIFHEEGFQEEGICQ